MGAVDWAAQSTRCQPVKQVRTTRSTISASEYCPPSLRKLTTGSHARAYKVYSTTSGGSVGLITPWAWAWVIHSPIWSLTATSPFR